MRIAVASTGEGIESQISMVFGRCYFIVFVDIEDRKIKHSYTKPNIVVSQGGAGLAATKLVEDNKAQAIIAGAFGHKAFGILNRLNVKSYRGIRGTVRNNIDRFVNQELERVTIATGPAARWRGYGRHGRKQL